MIAVTLVVVHVIAAARFALAHVAFAAIRATDWVFLFVAMKPTTHVVGCAIEPAAVTAIVIVVVAAIVPRVLAAHRIPISVVALTMIAVLFAAYRLGTTPLDLGAFRPVELRLFEPSNPVLVSSSVSAVMAIVAWH
jgi:hypothetical protein